MGLLDPSSSISQSLVVDLLLDLPVGELRLSRLASASVETKEALLLQSEVLMQLLHLYRPGNATDRVGGGVIRVV